jgi:hydroxymethylglutaryl-CoA lyase
MTDRVVLCECFARDGLQHEPEFVPTSTKVDLLGRFVAAGFRRIEASSYSHPTQVPAFSDVREVLRAVPRKPGVSYKVTCPNPKAVQRAIDDLDDDCAADELSFLVSASESHTQRNLRCSRDEQWQRVAEMASLADGRFILVGVVSVAFGCPFEGWVDPDVVVADVARFADLGARLVTIGDTTGVSNPRTSAELFGRLRREFPDVNVVAHFHNTRGTGIANAVAALDAGVRYFDSAMGGVGGHPSSIEYGAGLTGNVCTEDLVSVFEAMGVGTGIDPVRLQSASAACEAALGRPLYSMVARTGFASTPKEPSNV